MQFLQDDSVKLSKTEEHRKKSLKFGNWFSLIYLNLSLLLLNR